MVQGEGFALLEADVEPVFIVGVVIGHHPQCTADHQHRRHARGIGDEGTAAEVDRLHVVAGETDRAGAASEIPAFGGPTGIETGG
ncbi:hypothetical protein D3C76_1584560 [compost metagenome]